MFVDSVEWCVSCSRLGIKEREEEARGYGFSSLSFFLLVLTRRIRWILFGLFRQFLRDYDIHTWKGLKFNRLDRVEENFRFEAWSNTNLTMRIIFLRSSNGEKSFELSRSYRVKAQDRSVSRESADIRTIRNGFQVSRKPYPYPARR